QCQRDVATRYSSSESSTPALLAVAGSQLVQSVASRSNRRRTVVRTDGVDHLVGSLQLEHRFRSALEVVNDPNIGSLLDNRRYRSSPGRLTYNSTAKNIFHRTNQLVSAHSDNLRRDAGQQFFRRDDELKWIRVVIFSRSFRYANRLARLRASLLGSFASAVSISSAAISYSSSDARRYTALTI